jgi:hypothetical protein
VRRRLLAAAAAACALALAGALALPAVEQDPIKELNTEDLRLLHLAVADLAGSPQGLPDHGVPAAYPNDVVRYIVRYRAAAAPFLLGELAQAKDDRTAGWICYCLALVPIASADGARYRVAIARVRDRLADAERAHPGDADRGFALRCTGTALDVLDPSHPAAPPALP